MFDLRTQDEDNGTQFNLRMQRVAVQLLYGRKVKADDLLKISQTSLEDILNRESGAVADSTGATGSGKQRHGKRKRVRASEEAADAEDSIVHNPTVVRIVEMINAKAVAEDVTALVATLSAEEREALYATINKMEQEGVVGADSGDEEDDFDEEDEDFSDSQEGDEDEEEESVEEVAMPISPSAAHGLHQGVPLVRSNSIGSSSSSVRKLGANPRLLAAASKGSPRALDKGKKLPPFAHDAADEQDRKVRKTAAAALHLTAAGIAFGGGEEDPEAVAAAMFQLNSSINAKGAASSLLESHTHLLIPADENGGALKAYRADNQLEYLEE